MFFAVSLAFARAAEAQRSGFIIGFGLGPGQVAISSAQDREPRGGLAMDFHIGGVIGDSFELYYVHKGIIISTDEVGGSVGSGMAGLGFGYPLNPKISISGGIGVALWTELGPNGATEYGEGLGLFGGVRYKLNESGRWALGFDITYSEPFPDFNVVGAQITINVLSH
jgi:hypothetical protein